MFDVGRVVIGVAVGVPVKEDEGVRREDRLHVFQTLRGRLEQPDPRV